MMRRLTAAAMMLSTLVPIVVSESVSAATVLRVPDDHLTIAEAGAVAQPGDTILVGPGDHWFTGVPIGVDVVSTDGPSVTRLWGGWSANDRVIEGFTITEGRGGLSGDATVRGNRFEVAVGTILVPALSTATFEGNTFVDAQCDANTALIRVAGAASFTNNVFWNSACTTIEIRSGAQATLTNNTLVGNDEGLRVSSPDVVARNNIFADDTDVTVTAAPATLAEFDHNLFATPSVVVGAADPSGSNGNLTGTADFVDVTSGDAHIGPSSLAIDAGSDTGAPSEDVYGGARPIDGDGVGGTAIDIGAHEFDGAPPSPLPPLPEASFVWASEGDIVGNGTTGSLDQHDVSFRLDGTHRELNVRAAGGDHRWLLTITPTPDGSGHGYGIGNGSFVAGYRRGDPRFAIWSSSGRCLPAEASFTISDLRADLAGRWLSGRIEFVQRCKAGGPALVGAFHFAPPPGIQWPTAHFDTYDFDIDTTGQVPAPGLLGNDDPRGAVTAIEIVESPLSVTLSVEDDGAITAIPEPGAAFQTAFRYRVLVNGEWSAPTKVFLEFRPVAVADVYGVGDARGKPVTRSVLDNDSGASFVSLRTQPQQGRVTLHHGGTFTYTPIATFRGTDTFTYWISAGGDLVVGTVTMNVRNVDVVKVTTSRNGTVVYQNSDWAIRGDFAVDPGYVWTARVDGAVVINGERGGEALVSISMDGLGGARLFGGRIRVVDSGANVARTYAIVMTRMNQNRTKVVAVGIAAGGRTIRFEVTDFLPAA
jgi:hypothetical protein